MDEAEVCPLLDLPDPCLLAVLRCCANDQRTLLSAARAHSRLHQAAAAALSSISTPLSDELQLESLMVYLSNHNCEVTALEVPWARGMQLPAVSQLPPGLQLHTLDLAGAVLDLAGLHLSNDSNGSLNGGISHGAQYLTKLLLYDCPLLGEERDMYAALAKLSALHHLSLNGVTFRDTQWSSCTFEPQVLNHLPKLTFFEVGRMVLDRAEGVQLVQGLQQLPDLQVLQLSLCALPVPSQANWPWGNTALPIESAVLPVESMQHVTHLQLDGPRLEYLPVLAATMADMTQLQHLKVWIGRCGRSSGVAEGLSELQPLTQLTHLCVLLRGRHILDPAATTAYSALTVSSRLQHLEVSAKDPLPGEAWQYMMPAGRQLPSLHVLMDVTQGKDTPESYTPYTWRPDVSRIVNCCPALRELSVSAQCMPQQLEGLAGLTGLRQLAVGLPHAGWNWMTSTFGPGREPMEEIEALTHLTASKGLTLFTSCRINNVLKLTQLQQLQSLGVKRSMHDD